MGDKEVRPQGNVLLNVFRYEWKHLGSLRGRFLLYVLIFAISGTLDILIPVVISEVFNSIQGSTVGNIDIMRILLLLSFIFWIQLAFWIFHGMGRVLEARTGFFVRRNYINNMINKTLDLPMSWHKDNHSGKTIDKIQKGSTAIHNFSTYFTFQIIYIIIKLIGSIIILSFFDFTVAMIALVMFFITMTIVFILDRKLGVTYQRINKIENKYSAAIFDYLSNMFTVVTLRLKKTVKTEIDKRVMASYEESKKAISLNESKWGFASLAIAFMTATLIMFRVYNEYVATGMILIGTVYLLYSYLGKIGSAFFSITNIYGDLVRMDSRLKNAKDIEDEYDKLKLGSIGNLPSNWKQIDIEGLDFTYGQEEKKHLENINFSFKRGEKIALVGESGSGKSTFLSLLRGLYEPDFGHAYCDKNLLKNGVRQIQNNVTLIPQDPEIFNNTIKYNITMDLGYGKDDIVKAINLAQLGKIIRRLEKGLDTNVMEKGVSLSGGEKQRLALARGLLAAKKSDIILLDEPTSSVDSMNEMKIHENIFKEFKNKTIISSIHRLHLLDEFDKIVFFKDGKIIESGTLNEMKKNNDFKKLLNKYKRTDKRS